MWTPSERRFLRSLKSPQHIQEYLNELVYNPMNAALSPRYVMLSGDGHCLEGGLIAAAAFELQGHKPLLVDLVAHNDDHHILTVYKTKTGWGSVAKSNTTLLRGRSPFYRNVRELVMSYFDVYFNVAGKLSLYSYSDPINLNKFNHWNWRWTDKNLEDMGRSFNDIPHFELATQGQLNRHPKVHKSLVDACFLGADPDGLYEV